MKKMFSYLVVRLAVAWIDLLTHKHALLLREVGLYLREKGFEVFYTSRKMGTLTQFLSKLSINAEIVGSHGGRALGQKLVHSLERSIELAKLVMKKKPSIAISHASPEAARIAYGLGIPHVCISDSPHAEAVSKLTIPLSTHLLSPWVIARERWKPYLVPSCKLVTYRALDPAVWLKSAKHKPHKKPLVVVRPEEYYASYISGEGVSERLVTLLSKLYRKRGVRVKVFSRTREQAAKLRKASEGGIEVIYGVFDGAQVLSRAWVFIGLGGTMTCEAALLGVPVVALPPRDLTEVEKFLVKRGLVEVAELAEEAISIVEHVLENPEEAFEKWHKKSLNLWREISVEEFFQRLYMCVEQAT